MVALTTEARMERLELGDLHGLKQIAAFIGKSERWVQYAAARKGDRQRLPILPVYTLNGRWYAFKAELAAWANQIREFAPVKR